MTNRPTTRRKLLCATGGTVFGSGLLTASASGQTKTSERVIWKLRTSGALQGAPTVVDDTLHFAAGDNYVYAVDANTGDQQWRFETHGRITSSPVVADGEVYVGTTKRLSAVDVATGESRWISNGRFERSPVVEDGIIYAPTQEWLRRIDPATRDIQGIVEGATSAPTTVEDTVYVVTEDGFLQAVDAATGNTLWTHSPSNDPSDTNYYPPTLVDGTLYAASDGVLYAVDSTTGERQWSFELAYQLEPMVVDGTVYVGSYGHGKRSLCAVDSTTGEQQWSLHTPGGVHGVTYSGDTIYGTSESGLNAIDPVSGERQWFFETPRDNLSSATFSPVVVDGTVYTIFNDRCAQGEDAAGEDNGFVYAVDPETGYKQWSVRTYNPIQAPPAVVDGTVYVGSRDTLYALSAERDGLTRSDDSNSDLDLSREAGTCGNNRVEPEIAIDKHAGENSQSDSVTGLGIPAAVTTLTGAGYVLARRFRTDSEEQ